MNKKEEIVEESFYDLDEIDRKLAKAKRAERRSGPRRKQNYNPRYIAKHYEDYIKDNE